MIDEPQDEATKRPRKPAMVEVIATKRINPLGTGMVEIGQVVTIPRDTAKALQEANAVKVVL